MPHTSRKGWLAQASAAIRRNPFTVRRGRESSGARDGHGALSPARDCRADRAAVLAPIRRIADPSTVRLIARRDARPRHRRCSTCDERPAAYEDVGRLCAWDDLSTPAQLARSRYERVVIRAVSGQALRIGGQSAAPVGMDGWSAVVFRRARTAGAR